MQKDRDPVKSRVLWGCVIWGFALLTGCAARPVVSTDHHPNYLAQPLDPAPFENLRRKIQTDTDEVLQTRHEAHITLVTPPEWDLLKDRLTMTEIEDLAREQGWPHLPFQKACVGRGEKIERDRTLRTYFVVLRSSEMVALRRRLFALYKSRGGMQDFRPDHFYPHVTIGFTDRDLHEQDGIVKDERTCTERWTP